MQRRQTEAVQVNHAETKRCGREGVTQVEEREGKHPNNIVLEMEIEG